MFRIQREQDVEFVGYEVSKKYIEAMCDSTDTKPTEGISEGSSVIETDTGNIFLFNEKTGTWVKQFSLKE